MPQRIIANSNRAINPPPTSSKTPVAAKQPDQYDQDDEDESTIAPQVDPPAQKTRNKRGRHGQKSEDSEQGETTYVNPCCCDCTLQEGVGWISAVEFIWGIIFMFVCASFLAMYHQADYRLRKNLSPDEYDDKEWQRFGNAHNGAVIGALILHLAEAIVALFLMAAASRRVRCLCFMWIAAISLIFIGELALVIIDPCALTYVTVAINPVRFYFGYIIWALAQEILIYPNGPPVTIYVQNVQGVYRGTVVAEPVYPTQVVVQPYPYGYYPYRYYGYPYYYY